MKAYFAAPLILLFLVAGCLPHPETTPSGGDDNDGGGGGGGSQTDAPALTALRFEKSKNPGLSRDVELQLFDTRRAIWGYMPNTASAASLVLSFTITNGKLLVDGVEQQSGVTAHDFTSPVTYTMRGNNGVSRDYTLSVLPYTGLPVVMFSHSDGKSFLQTVLNKRDWKAVTMTIDALGLPGYQDMEVTGSVRGRGNTTWSAFPKKAFNLKLDAKPKPAAGQPNTIVLGMPGQKRWSFLANWRDRSLLRNDVTWYIARTVATGMEWNPRCQFVEVVFNGEHMGNYLMTEHVRVDENRVNIHEMTPDDLQVPELTGGYLLEIDYHYDEDPKFQTAYYTLPAMIKNPEADDAGIFPAKQQQYIEGYIAAIEKALKAHRYTDLYDSIDRASFVDFWIVESLVGNIEITAPIGNLFLYKKRMGKLYAGPVWDLDHTTFSVEGASSNSRPTILVGNKSWWYEDLMADPAFKEALRVRFNAIESALATVPAYINQRATQIAASEAVDRKMWPLNEETMAGRLDPNTLNGDEVLPTYRDAVDRMIAIYNARLAKMRNYLNNGTWQ